MASPFLQDRGLPNYTGSPRLYIVGLGCSKLEKMAKHISPFEKRIRRRDVGIVGQELKISRYSVLRDFRQSRFSCVFRFTFPRTRRPCVLLPAILVIANVDHRSVSTRSCEAPPVTCAQRLRRPGRSETGLVLNRGRSGPLANGGHLFVGDNHRLIRLLDIVGVLFHREVISSIAKEVSPVREPARWLL